MARSLDQYCGALRLHVGGECHWITPEPLLVLAARADPDAGGLGFSAAMEALGEAVQLERAAQDSCKDSLWDYLPKELVRR